MVYILPRLGSESLSRRANEWTCRVHFKRPSKAVLSTDGIRLKLFARLYHGGDVNWMRSMQQSVKRGTSLAVNRTCAKNRAGRKIRYVSYRDKE